MILNLPSGAVVTGISGNNVVGDYDGLGFEASLVPEPSTMGLFSLFVAGLFASRRRK